MLFGWNFLKRSSTYVSGTQHMAFRGHQALYLFGWNFPKGNSNRTIRVWAQPYRHFV